jgi:LmbE family N-acetylglucosaminyl deacetylase
MFRRRQTSIGTILVMVLLGGFGFAQTGRSQEQEHSVSATLAANAARQQASAEEDDGKLRIIVFGAHPDDCEIRAGGSAILWSDAGHHVKFVSATNGDIGHFAMAGGELARRRYAEVQAAAKILGTTTEVLDIHDGELMPTLENRRAFTRQMRGWNADLVIGHRPNDYHPDHRYTGVLMQDSAYMVAVPFFCPDVPPLKKNPTFLYSYDRFQRPNPFRPDVVVSIDSVIERKVDALVAIESQFVEGGALGAPNPALETPEGKKARVEVVRNSFKNRFKGIADSCRDKLIELYGPESGSKVQYAEAFEICEYGRKPSKEDLKRLFPFLGEQ